MSDSAVQSVLRRKALANRPETDLLSIPHGALLDAFVRTADKSISLHASAVSSNSTQASLAELLDMMPEKGMLAVLDGPKETPGVMIIDPELLSGLVEHQTIGDVNAVAATPRRATRTDASLVAPFIDMLLGLLAEDMAETEHRPWTDGYKYSASLPDARPFALLLEDETYNLLEITVSIGEVERECKLTLALLAKGRGAAPVVSKKKSSFSDGPQFTSAEDPVKWGEAFELAVQDSTVALNGVLHRLPMTISNIDSLKVGDIVPVPLNSVTEVRIEGRNGILIGEGRLGQSMKKRAIRISQIGAREVEAEKRAKERAFVSDHDTADGVRPADPAALMALETQPPSFDMSEPSEAPSFTPPEADGFDELGVLNDLPDLPEPPDLPDLDFGGGETSPDLSADLPDVSSVELELPDLGDASSGIVDLPDLDLSSGEEIEIPDLPPNT